jgi:hypothetical protein
LRATAGFETQNQGAADEILLGTPAVFEAGSSLGPAAAAAGGAAAAELGGSVPGVPVSISKEALYSLQYSTDLLEAVGEADIQEMRQVLLEGLCELSGTAAPPPAAAAAVTGAVRGSAAAAAAESAAAAAARGGWHVGLVGGGRRSKSVHDADFLVTHPTVELEGEALQTQLVFGAGRFRKGSHRLVTHSSVQQDGAGN